MPFLTFEQFCIEFNSLADSSEYQTDLPMVYLEWISLEEKKDEAGYEQWLQGLSSVEQSRHLGMICELNIVGVKHAFLDMGEVDTSEFSESQLRAHDERMDEAKKVVNALLEIDLKL